MQTFTKNIDRLREEVAAHIAADAVIQGDYWRPSNCNAVQGKGCFIGCLSHANEPKVASKRFGLPIAVLRIAENIFEHLPKDDAVAFFAAFPDAVGCNGKDLSRVHWQFLANELRTLPTTSRELQTVIAPVIAGIDLLSSGKIWPVDARARAYLDAHRYNRACAAYAIAYPYLEADTDCAAAIAVAYATDANANTYADVDSNNTADAATVTNATTYVVNTHVCAAITNSNVNTHAYANIVRRRQRDTLLHLIATTPIEKNHA